MAVWLAKATLGSDTTVISKWKLLFVNGCEGKSVYSDRIIKILPR